MADATYQPGIYRKQGGNQLVVSAAGTLNLEPSATLTLGSLAFAVQTNSALTELTGHTTMSKAIYLKIGSVSYYWPLLTGTT